MPIRVAHQIPCTEAEGPGRRHALWVQGCDLGCPGCCNPELFGPGGGRELDPRALAAEIVAGAAARRIEGITVLGGEPLQQLDAVATLCAGVRAGGLGVIVFTGYTLAQARRLPGFARLWTTLDTLVDGPFDPQQPEPRPGGRLPIGSRNQVLHHRSDRYADPLCWRGPELAELRVGPGGELSVHGPPGAVGRMASLLRAPASAGGGETR